VQTERRHPVRLSHLHSVAFHQFLALTQSKSNK
jgi:hypothetical protein